MPLSFAESDVELELVSRGPGVGSADSRVVVIVLVWLVGYECLGDRIAGVVEDSLH